LKIANKPSALKQVERVLDRVEGDFNIANKGQLGALTDS